MLWVRAAVVVTLLWMPFALANELCLLSFLELSAAKAKWEARVAQASGPHIPPDREAEAMLLKIENELRRRNGLPPLAPPAPPAPKLPPASVVVSPPTEQAAKVTALMGKITLLEQKLAWTKEQDALTHAREPDPEIKKIEMEVASLTKELQAKQNQHSKKQ